MPQIRRIRTGGTTDGLASPYQTLQMTGGAQPIVDTGYMLRFGAIPLPIFVILPSEDSLPDQRIPEESDPALAPFVGPLGQARTHTERALQFRQNYRPALDDSTYMDMPEDVL